MDKIAIATKTADVAITTQRIVLLCDNGGTVTSSAPKCRALSAKYDITRFDSKKKRKKKTHGFYNQQTSKYK